MPHNSLGVQSDFAVISASGCFRPNDEWQSQNRYMQIEGFALIDAVQTDPLLSITTQAA